MEQNEENIKITTSCSNKEIAFTKGWDVACQKQISKV